MTVKNLSQAGESDVFVTYRTSHPTGHYYVGKSSLRRIQKGYQGSGPRFKCALHVPGFEAHTWHTEILSTHQHEGDAYATEAMLVTLNMLADPYCLNTTLGGKTRCWGSPYTKFLKTFTTPRAKKPTTKGKLPKGMTK